MEAAKPIFTLNIGSIPIDITMNMVVQWIIMIALIALATYLTQNLKEIPDKRQTIAEMFVGGIRNLVKENMGEEYKSLVPIIGTIAIYLLSMNLFGFFGIEPPTQSLGIALSMGIITFIIIQTYAIKKLGLFHYFMGYGKPVFVMLPLNLLERVMLPVSLSLRLFGNMFAATYIMSMAYGYLDKVAWAAQLAVPIPLHLYFDAFDGTIQTIIFLMISMINIKIIAEH